MAVQVTTTEVDDLTTSYPADGGGLFTEADLARAEAFAAEVTGHQAAAYNAVLTYLGDRLGIWRTLASPRA